MQWFANPNALPEGPEGNAVTDFFSHDRRQLAVLALATVLVHAEGTVANAKTANQNPLRLPKARVLILMPIDDSISGSQLSGSGRFMERLSSACQRFFANKTAFPHAGKVSIPARTHAA